MSDRRGRKKRDEPFNPFAPSASAQRNKRPTERKDREQRSPQTRSNPSDSKSSGLTELAEKQKEAMERMKKQQGGATKPPNSRKESSEKAMRVTEFCSKHQDAREIIESMESLLGKLSIPRIGTDFAVRWKDVELAIKGSSIEQKTSEDRLSILRRKSAASRANASRKKNPTHTVETHIEPNSDQHLNKSSSPASKTRKNVFKPVAVAQRKPRQRGKNSSRNKRNKKNTRNKARTGPKSNKKPAKQTQSKADKKVVLRAEPTVQKIKDTRRDLEPRRRKEIIDGLRPEHQRKKHFLNLETIHEDIRKLERKPEPSPNEMGRLRDEFILLLKHFNY